MLCEFCDYKDVCRYRSDTEDYERNFKSRNTGLENLTIKLECKHKRYTISNTLSGITYCNTASSPESSYMNNPV